MSNHRSLMSLNRPKNFDSSLTMRPAHQGSGTRRQSHHPPADAHVACQSQTIHRHVRRVPNRLSTESRESALTPSGKTGKPPADIGTSEPPDRGVLTSGMRQLRRVGTFAVAAVCRTISNRASDWTLPPRHREDDCRNKVQSSWQSGTCEFQCRG